MQFMLKGPLLANLYQNAWYSGQNYTERELGYVLNENRLLGAARLRQVRARNGSCLIADDFKMYINSCYDTYTSVSEDTTPFGSFGNGSALVPFRIYLTFKLISLLLTSIVSQSAGNNTTAVQ